MSWEKRIEQWNRRGTLEVEEFSSLRARNLKKKKKKTEPRRIFWRRVSNEIRGTAYEIGSSKGRGKIEETKIRRKNDGRSFGEFEEKFLTFVGTKFTEKIVEKGGQKVKEEVFGENYILEAIDKEYSKQRPIKILNLLYLWSW